MINLAEMAEGFVARDAGAAELIDAQSGITRTFGDLSRRTGLLAAAFVRRVWVSGRARGWRRCRVTRWRWSSCIWRTRARALLFPLNWRFSASQVAGALRDASPAVAFYEAEFPGVLDPVRGEVERAWIEWATARGHLVRGSAGPGLVPHRRDPPDLPGPGSQ
jgi:hypothetical protein